MGCDLITTNEGEAMDFNPRTRMGCDCNGLLCAGRGDISIHAPAWGATAIPSKLAPILCKFQSTHPHGVRPVLQQTVNGE